MSTPTCSAISTRWLKLFMFLNIITLCLFWLSGAAPAAQSGKALTSALEQDFRFALTQSKIFTPAQKAAWLDKGLTEIKRLQYAGINEDLIRDLLQNALDADWEAGLFLRLGQELGKRVAGGEDQFKVVRELVIRALLNERPQQVPAIRAYSQARGADLETKPESADQKPNQEKTPPPAGGGVGLATKQSSSSDMSKVSGQALRDTMREWLDAPYLWGGDHKSGVDCSGFVKAVYAEQGVELPRGSYFLSQTGYSVHRSDYRMGDVLIFKRNGRTVHVGIYLGSNRFIHSAKGMGVGVSNLADEKYWNMLSDVRRVAQVKLPVQQYAQTESML